MNSNSRRIRLYTYITLFLAFAATAFRTSACLLNLEYRWGYFTSNTLIITASILITICAIFAISYAFFSEKTALHPSFSSPATYIPTALVATALIFISVFLLGNYMEADNTFSRFLIIAAAISAILSLIHFFLNAFVTEAHTETRAFFSLSTVLFLAFYASYLYFDSALPINSANKLTDQLAFLFAALFFLYESRISLGRERWRAYVGFGLLAAAFCAYSSIPSLIVYFAKGKIISNSIEEITLTFTLFIFIVSRIFLTSTLREVKVSRFIDAMRSYAERKGEVIVESIKVHKEAFGTQMTIDDLIPDDDDANYLVNTFEHENVAQAEVQSEADDEAQEDIFSVLDSIAEDEENEATEPQATEIIEENKEFTPESEPQNEENISD